MTNLKPRRSEVHTALQKVITDTESFYERVLVPPRGNPILFNNPTILAFDSEFEGNTLLTIQLAKGKDQSKMYVIKEPVLRLQKFAECLRDFSGLEEGTIYLIVHFGNAEARYLEDFFHNFRDIKQIHSGLHYSGEVGPFKIIVKDLFSFYPMSLESIGRTLGFSKSSLDGVGGKSVDYWMPHMSEFLENHPREFEAYARTDAEITATAFNNLRDRYLEKNVELLQLYTMPSVAFADFRRNDLKKAAAPWEVDQRVAYRKNKKTGAWELYLKPVIVFDGDLNVRKYAGLASWGAINTLLWFGYRKEKEAFAQYLDIKSLYVAATLLQPLPNIETEWSPIQNLEDIEDMEGFARVDFRFKDDENFPNLACQCIEMPGTTIFPLQGRTHEAFSQIRQALKFGAEITNIKGYGFTPGPNEKDHDLGRFLRPMFAAKDQAVKNSLEYLSNKLQMVALIGRFNYKPPKEDLASKIKHFKTTELDLDEYILSGRTKHFRLKDKADKMIAGPSFTPEWSTLILAKARMLIAGICHIGGCFHVSTDGGFWGLEKVPEILQSPEVLELRSVGSDLRPEGTLKNPEGFIDECFVSRTRFYATWLKGEEVHHARQAIHTMKSSKTFGNPYDMMLRSDIAALAPVILQMPNMRLSKARDVLEGKAPRMSDPIYNYGNISYHRGFQTTI